MTKTMPVGRRRGVPNKVSASVKENILAVFVRLGGTAAMAAWAQANPVEFYRIYARLIPTDMKMTVNGNITVIRRDPTQRSEGYRRRGGRRCDAQASTD